MSSSAKNHLVFDLETSGLPECESYGVYYPESDTSKYDSSRIVQIAYLVYDCKNAEVKRVNKIIRPEGFVIKNSEFHGITQEMALKGDDFGSVAMELAKDLKGCDTLVSHNIKFDFNVLSAELFRRGLGDILALVKGMGKECTMELSKGVCKIKRGSHIKDPKLTEAYAFIVKKEVSGKLHDAMTDVVLCAEIYHALKFL